LFADGLVIPTVRVCRDSVFLHESRCCCPPPRGRPLQAYYILDEVLIGGHLQDVNKREILRVCAAQDDLMEEAKEGPTATPR
jgi:hypothetical protein